MDLPYNVANITPPLYKCDTSCTTLEVRCGRVKRAKEANPRGTSAVVLEKLMRGRLLIRLKFLFETSVSGAQSRGPCPLLGRIECLVRFLLSTRTVPSYDGD